MGEFIVERTVLSLTQARLEKLAEYEGCVIRLCRGESCWSGVLEEVDVRAATVSIRSVVDNVLLILTIDPNDWELQVYKCLEGGRNG